MSEASCGQVMAPFVEEISRRSDLPAVQIIGGNGSAALLSDESVIDLDAGIIHAPRSCDLPRFRPDGTLRDMDALVLSTDQHQIDRVEDLAERLVGGELMISIFGLKSAEVLRDQERHPLRSTARVFLGDRYVTDSVDEAGSLVLVDGFKALFPFKAPVTTDALATFQLSTGGPVTVPTSHPGATILNYLTRSISGVRDKDVHKLGAMADNVLVRYPEVLEWITDGPGRDMLELARLLHTLRQPRRRPQPLQVGNHLTITPYRLSELRFHHGFVAKDRGPFLQRTLVETAHLKSRGLGWFESRPALRTFWQNNIEHRLRSIVHNDG